MAARRSRDPRASCRGGPRKRTLRGSRGRRPGRAHDTRCSSRGVPRARRLRPRSTGRGARSAHRSSGRLHRSPRDEDIERAVENVRSARQASAGRERMCGHRVQAVAEMNDSIYLWPRDGVQRGTDYTQQRHENDIQQIEPRNRHLEDPRRCAPSGFVRVVRVRGHRERCVRCPAERNLAIASRAPAAAGVPGRGGGGRGRGGAARGRGGGVRQ